MARPETLKQAIPGVGRLLQHMWPYMHDYRPLLAGSFLALFAGVAMRALEPWPLKFVFDYLILPSAVQNHPSEWIQGLEPMTLVTLAAMSLVFILGLRGLCTYYWKVGFALVGNKVLTRVRGALFRHIQCLSLSFHSKARSGDLIVRVIGDIGLLKDVAVTAFMPLIGSVLILASMAGLMLWLNWKLALLVLLSAPLYWLPTLLLSRKIQRASRTQRKRESAMASTAAESINAMQVVQTLSLDDAFADQFTHQNEKSLKEGVRVKRLLARLEGTVQLMTGVSAAAVLFYGTVLVLRGALSAGELLVFLSYLKVAFKPMQDFAKYSGRMAKASAAGERVIDIFNIPADVADAPDARPAPPFSGTVEFDQVSYGYNPGHPVLKDIDFSVQPGQLVSIVGASGAGKSTIIGMLSRLYDPDRGRVLIDGIDIRHVTLASLRSQISVVLQDTVLFATSIQENIAFGLPDCTDEEIVDAARLANAHQFIEAFPDGYDTWVGERGVTLSVGQRQRIAIARAILRKAPILILDEPTRGLDRESRQAIMKAVARLCTRQTTFLITHEFQDAVAADLILYIENGGVSECGTHEELIVAQGSYSRLARAY